MKDGFVKVAAATPIIKIADTEYNARTIVSLIKDADNCGIKLLVFPELCITGYTLNDLLMQQMLHEGVQNAIEFIQNATKDIEMLIFIGAPLSSNGKFYNTAIALNEGKILGVIPKTNLPNHSEYYEKRYFTPFSGDNSRIKLKDKEYPFGQKIIFRHGKLKSFTVSAELCEDLWLTCPPSSMSASKGANIIANLAATNDIIGKEDFVQSLIKTQSIRGICGYIFANAGEGESTTDMVFSGKNYIYEYGACLAQSKSFSSGLTVSEVDVDKLYFEKVKIHAFSDNYTDYDYIEFNTGLEQTELTRNISNYPFVPIEDAQLKERTEKVLEIQANGLKRRIEHTNADCLIVGISGGLDSCLALIAAAKAAGLASRSKKSIFAVTLPCFGTTSKTLENAKRLIEELGVSIMQIDITESVKRHLKDIGHEGGYDVTYENAQARERMQVLMDIANQKNGLVVGTGNLSESALGFTTYNGDHMSMYAVNNSLPKTLLRKMVQIIADNSSKRLKALLYDILDTPISPELIPSHDGKIVQNTENIIGPYELHDFFLYYFVRWGFAPQKILRLADYAFNNYKKEEIICYLKLFVRRFFASQFKRSCMPDCVQIGTVSLSPRANWKMPSDAGPELWLKELDSLE